MATRTERHPPIEVRVLELLAVRSGTIAFNGLRRMLQVHPESLARALRRLERSAQIVRGPQGYLLPDPPVRNERRSAPSRPVTSVELPPGTNPSELYGRLAGRWMGALRWAGIEEPDGTPWLVWTLPEPPARLLLTVRGRHLKVHTDHPGDDPRVGEAAITLLARSLEELRHRPAHGPVPTEATWLAREEPLELPN